MTNEFTVRWSGVYAADPQDVWDAITLHTGGWLWPVEYERHAGGAERGLSSDGGTVTAWEPPVHFGTRAVDSDGGVNELDYRLEPRDGGTYLSFTHNGLAADAQELDACRKHTAFYYHSLGEYVRHFAGRHAVYVTADAPQPPVAPTHDGFAAVCRALGVPDGATAGDRVLLTPAGLDPLDGVIDYRTPEFLGIRTADALYRVYGRDGWGWPVGLAHHLFGGDHLRERQPALTETWSRWLTSIFDSRAVA